MKRLFSVVLFVLLSVAVMGQMANDYTVRFIGRLNGAHYQRMDSVRFTNLTRGWSETIIYPDTIIVLNATVDVLDNEFKTGGFEQNVPNPFDCHTMAELSVPQDENVRLQLFDAAGKQCADLNVALNAGSHRFEITASKPQAYILKAIAGAKTYSVRMINVGSCGSDGIKYGGYVGENTKLTIENEFQVGDNMEFVGYATIAGNVVESEIVSMQLGQSQDVALEFRSETIGILNGHEWVDLGLPSGLLWATCNVGADSLTGLGNYYAWGETIPKTYYDWLTYVFCYGYENGYGSTYELTKYCYCWTWAYHSITDTLTILEACDDAATANWGAGWRMPGYEEFVELLEYCNVFDTAINGVNGRLYIGPNENSIFSPKAGYWSHTGVSGMSSGSYWSRSLYYYDDGIECEPDFAWGLEISQNDIYDGVSWGEQRCFGRSVRPVCSRDNINDSIVISLPTVITDTASEITTSGAIISGNVTSDGGASVTDRGFIYGTSANNLTQVEQSGIGTGNFAANLSGLTTGTTYYYKAYATNAAGTAYGEVMSFATIATTGTLNGHGYVDLGLPSGTLWATCNVGATNPTDYGNYYAWGETTTKETYSWDTYRYSNGSYNTLTKYCNNSSYGNNGYTDELTTLDASDDAATANWGSVWRMPTFDEFSELITNCTITYLDYPEYEVPGRLFVGPNGNSIFLPWASELSDNDMFNPVPAHYWSSSLYTGIPSCAWQLYFDPDTSFMHYSGYRSYGRSVRPVWSRANDNDSTTISVPTVITGTASDITTSGAVISGNVISDGGVTVTDRGFIYGIDANNLTQNLQCGTGTGIYANTLVGLNPSTIYYYKAYATNAEGTAYGEVMSFMTENVGDPTGTLNGHDWVDLGLPSGTRWATCNVGSTTPECYGDYFAWGETSTKTIYTEDNYTYTGNPITLPTSADAATANWGNGWRMPTREEMDELYRNCTREWTTQNDVNGEKFIGPNGNSIFLPAAGYRHDGDLDNASSRGYYWLSSLSTNYSRYAFNFIFDSGNCDLYNGSRVNGLSVRPVCDQ